MTSSTVRRAGRIAALTSLPLLVFGGLGGCSSAEKDYARELPEGAPALELVTDPKEMPYFGKSFGNRENLEMAIDRSLEYLAKPSSKKYFPVRGLPELTHERTAKSLEEMKKVLATARTEAEFQGHITTRFDVYRSVGWNGKGEVLFTAYCEPIVDGARRPGGRFQYPLYALPPELVKDEEGTCLGLRTPAGALQPCWTRAEIDGQGALRGRDLEICWLDDPFKAYIVQIQGSARVNLPDGTQLCLGYAGKTDRPYRSIGLHLVEKGEFTRNELSLTRLKKWFRENPERLTELYVNESYVFFTERDPGPYGSLGVKVTGGRTVATDKSLFPRGGLAYVVAKVPVELDESAWQDRLFHTFVLDQDTGGAIRSAGRADLFLGTGDRAERRAGRVRSEGWLFYLFVKEDGAPAGAPAETPGGGLREAGGSPRPRNAAPARSGGG